MIRACSLILIVSSLLATPLFAPVHRRHVFVRQFPIAPRDWLQFGGDASHRGSSNSDLITPQNVAMLRPIFSTNLPAISDGTPAYWTADSQRRSNHVLFFTATNGMLIALRANGRLLWQTVPPPGPGWTTSSPALDPSLRFVYSYALDGRVHKYAIRTGEEVIDTVWPVLVTHKGDVEKGSSALTIATRPNGMTYLYATLAGYPDPGDAGDYQGHVVAIRLHDGATSVFNALCSDKGHVLQLGECQAHRAGLWARGGVAYDEADDSLYVTASNGPYNGRNHWGDSILRLPPDLHVANGLPLDSYTPDEHAYLAEKDLDLGSSGLAIVGAYGVQAAKDSVVRVVRLADLSGHHAPGWTGGEIDRVQLPQGGAVLTAPAVWYDGDQPWIYFANPYGISAFQLVAGHLVEQWTSPEESRSSPVVVNGVLFSAANGKVYAIDAKSGNELWSDTSIANIHWESPLVVNGGVYITDFTGAVHGWALPPEITFR